MENFTYLSCNDFPWQVSSPCLFLNFRDELSCALHAPGITHQRESTKLTDEAFWMLFLTLAFVGLGILGSAITFYESFMKVYRKSTITALQEINSPESFGFLEKLKSFLKCFCIVSNGRRILNTATIEGRIDCFHGLRVLGNISVINLHTKYFCAAVLRNFDKVKAYSDLKTFFLMVNIEYYAVDTFLVISGFLNARSFFHKYRSTDGNISWFDFYFKRYIRLTPMLLIILGFHTTLFTYTGTAILWPTYTTNPVCQKDWWRYIFYVNNFKETANQCLGWCWSMAADMQFYVLSPLFMVSLIRWPWFGYALIFVCISGSCIISSMLTYHYNLIDSLSRYLYMVDDIKLLIHKYCEYFDLVHQKPYTRISPYLVAILLAYFLHKEIVNTSTSKINAMTLGCGWIITAILMGICLNPFHHGEVLIVRAVYFGTKPFLFSCSLAWIIYLCVTGPKKFLNKFLSWKFFHPLSRLTYCAYLIHPLVLARMTLLTEEFTDLSFISMIWVHIYVLIYTYFVSFFVSTLFEMPLLNLASWLGWRKLTNNMKLPHFE